MGLLQTYLRARDATGSPRAASRLTVIGRRDRLPGRLADDIAAAEPATAAGRRLHLRIALDYSARARDRARGERCSAHAAASPDRLRPADRAVERGRRQRAATSIC